MKNILLFYLLIVTTMSYGQGDKKINPAEFLPAGYAIFEKLIGDLNRDGLDDCVLIIKGMKKKHIVQDDNRTMVDRNRRGIIVLFFKDGVYELVSSNYSCFSSENEDGGVYYAPELSIEINNGKLYIQYAHGRYVHWKYSFRFQNSDFDLIGYDRSESSGPITEKEYSINFLTKKKLVKVNVNENAEGGDEVFKETWMNIRINQVVKLSQVVDFDNLDMSIY